MELHVIHREIGVRYASTQLKRSSKFVNPA